ncbi:MAG TPA: hypothetical protein PKD32_07735 [Saprospiraceae bacterium]|nr:hypothetical protein [Saprospiraceae bacterium]
MTKAILLVCLICSFTFESKAQENDHFRRNALYLELGKNGLLINAVYDHTMQQKMYGIQFNLGSNFGANTIALTIGSGIYKLIGNHRQFLEFGLDLKYFILSIVHDDVIGLSDLVYPGKSIRTIYPSVNCGYRNFGTKTVFRMGLSPGYIDRKVFLGAYISFGFRFK